MTPEDDLTRRVADPYMDIKNTVESDYMADLMKLRSESRKFLKRSAGKLQLKRLLAAYFLNNTASFLTIPNPKRVLGIACMFRFCVLAEALDRNLDEKTIHGAAENIVTLDSTAVVWMENVRFNAVDPPNKR